MPRIKEGDTLLIVDGPQGEVALPCSSHIKKGDGVIVVDGVAVKTVNLINGSIGISVIDDAGNEFAVRPGGSGTLYGYGIFPCSTRALGSTAQDRMGVFDGDRWWGIGRGFSATVRALVVWSNQLIVAGDDGIKAWNGHKWQALATTAFTGLLAHGNDLYAWNDNGVKKYNGSTWQTIPGPAKTNYTRAELMALYTPDPEDPFHGDYEGGILGMHIGDCCGAGLAGETLYIAYRAYIPVGWYGSSRGDFCFLNSETGELLADPYGRPPLFRTLFSFDNVSLYVMENRYYHDGSDSGSLCAFSGGGWIWLADYEDYLRPLPWQISPVFYDGGSLRAGGWVYDGSAFVQENYPSDDYPMNRKWDAIWNYNGKNYKVWARSGAVSLLAWDGGSEFLTIDYRTGDYTYNLIGYVAPEVA